MKSCLMLLLAALLASRTVAAAVPPDQAAALGTSLTPVGAERAASANGSIPAWKLDQGAGAATGAILPGGEPEPDEAPMFVITGNNVNRFRDVLTDGHQKLLIGYNSYFMRVYPARRGVRWPAAVEAATRDNATNCRLGGSDEPDGCRLGFPFPRPQSGAEAIWNHKLRWRGETGSTIQHMLLVDPEGHFQATQLREQVRYLYASLAAPQPLAGSGRDIYQLVSRPLAPPRLVGSELLLHERSGTGSEGRRAWLAQRSSPLVRREPGACCARFREGSDGMQFYDQADMFNGTLERYRWRLVGKRELLIAANSAALPAGSASGDFGALVKPWHLNPAWPRYELHRVWVVEAELKEGTAHPVRKRVLYLDEDSWQIAAVDLLDADNQPYQFQEAHLRYDPHRQATVTVAEALYQFNSERYLLSFSDEVSGETPATDFYTPAALQRRLAAGR